MGVTHSHSRQSRIINISTLPWECIFDYILSRKSPPSIPNSPFWSHPLPLSGKWWTQSVTNIARYWTLNCKHPETNYFNYELYPCTLCSFTHICKSPRNPSWSWGNTLYPWNHTHPHNHPQYTSPGHSCPCPLNSIRCWCTLRRPFSGSVGGRQERDDGCREVCPSEFIVYAVVKTLLNCVCVRAQL